MSFVKPAVLAFSLMSLPVQAQPVEHRTPMPISWSEMIWDNRALTKSGQNVPHAALLVDVRLDSLDIPGTMQLDTGSDAVAVYANTYDSLHPKEMPGDKYWIGLTGTIAGRPIRGDWFSLLYRGAPVPPPRKPPLLGKIGAPFFERRVLLLDFVAQRLAILARDADLPPELERLLEFVPLEYHDRKMFVAVTLNGVENREFFFDTGASAVPLETTRPRWLELTGRQPQDPENAELKGESAGVQMRWVGAPLKGDLRIGKVSLSRPLVYFEPTGAANFDFDKYPFKTSGLFGNAPFDGRFTVVVDLPLHRFGIYEGSLAGIVGK